jgi:hypothetical protein
VWVFFFDFVFLTPSLLDLKIPIKKKRMLALALLWVFCNVQAVRFGSKFCAAAWGVGDPSDARGGTP